MSEILIRINYRLCRIELHLFKFLIRELVALIILFENIFFLKFQTIFVEILFFLKISNKEFLRVGYKNNS